MTRLPASPTPALRPLELGPGDERLLQAFFDGNPLYFESVNGEVAGPNEARGEIDDQPPPGWPFTKKWLIGYVDETGKLAAMASVIRDLSLVPRDRPEAQ